MEEYEYRGYVIRALSLPTGKKVWVVEEGGFIQGRFQNQEQARWYVDGRMVPCKQV